MNSVQLIGRLTRDPDADQTAGGTPVTTFRLAIDRRGPKGADFVTIRTCDRLAEVVPSIWPVAGGWWSRAGSPTRSRTLTGGAPSG